MPAAQAPEFLMQFFSTSHLDRELGAVSERFGQLAAWIVEALPRNPERTTALRKLLEAKDCAVRTIIAQRNEAKGEAEPAPAEPQQARTAATEDPIWVCELQLRARGSSDLWRESSVRVAAADEKAAAATLEDQARRDGADLQIVSITPLLEIAP